MNHKTVNLIDSKYSLMLGLPFARKDHLNRFPEEAIHEIISENKALDFLGYHLSGGVIFFETSSRELHFEISYQNEPLMNHMSPLGESGFDIYLLHEGDFIFYDSIRPFPRENYVKSFVKLPHKDKNTIMMYTPLYARVLHLDLKIEEHATLSPFNPKFDKKIFFYGTSITQGACASRPGMSYTNQISRILNAEIINMGFSGNGLGEISIAKLTHHILDLDMVIIDYEANAGAIDRLKSTLIPFIECIREKHHQIPIVVIGRIPFVRELFNDEDHAKRLDHQAFQMHVVKNSLDLMPLYYVKGETLISQNEYDVTVDGIHLNDLGMTLFASRLSPILKDILNQ